MLIYLTLNRFFEDNLDKLKCEEYTKSYIISIFNKYKNSQFDYSKDSITLKYYNAKTQYDFAEFQNLADYLFFVKTLFPESLNNASADYYDTIAKVSYYSCYRIINKQLIIYERLADEFEILTDQTREIFIHRT